MELMKNLDQDTIDQAHALIASLEEMIEAGNPPSETQVKKLDKLFEAVMASKSIPALLTTKDGYGQLNPELSNRLHTMVDHVEEVVGVEHLVHALRDGTSHRRRCEVLRRFRTERKSPHRLEGVSALQLRRMLDANANVMVFLADWHAWVNDKFNGDMDAIKTTGESAETFARLNHTPKGTVPVNYASSGPRN